MGTQTNKELFSYGLIHLLLEQQEEDVRLLACESNPDTGLLAHKFILSARSKVFKKMFESDIGKASTKLETITFSELKQEELEAFVEFIYTDGCMLSEKAKKHVMSLYRAADKYEIPHLRDLCRDTIIASLDTSNILKVLELSQIPFDEALTDAALTALRNNLCLICSSTECEAVVINHPNITFGIGEATSGCCSYCGRQCQ